MKQHPFPIVVFPSHEVRLAFGARVDEIAGLALRALLKERGTLEVAHQQVRYRSHHLAFSSRIGNQGDLILELGIGDSRHAGRVIVEADLRKAAIGATPPRRPRNG